MMRLAGFFGLGLSDRLPDAQNSLAIPRASHTDGCDRWSVQSLSRSSPAERALPTDVRSEPGCYARRGPKAA